MMGGVYSPIMATIRSGKIEVSAAEKGAELQSIKGPDGTEYLWQGDAAFWNRRSPLLFPNVGALPGGTFSHRGRTYSLGNHGFARGRDFRLASSSPGRMRFELRSDEATRALYPFDFLLAVSYEVEGDRLSVGWEVRNEGGEEMSFSIGAHPGFNVPLAPGERREDYEILFEKAERVDRLLLNADNVRTGEAEPFLAGQDRVGLQAALFEKGAVVLASPASRRATLRSRRSGRFVELSFPGFPSLGLWSPKDNDHGPCPFVCIEPWYGIMPLAGSTQELRDKEGVLRLAPDKSFEAEYSIRIG